MLHCYDEFRVIANRENSRRNHNFDRPVDRNSHANGHLVEAINCHFAIGPDEMLVVSEPAATQTQYRSEPEGSS